LELFDAVPVSNLATAVLDSRSGILAVGVAERYQESLETLWRLMGTSTVRVGVELNQWDFAMHERPAL